MSRVALAFAGLSLLAFGVFLKLPARSVDLRRADIVEAERGPANGSFAIAELAWDLDSYRADPHLQPLRNYFQEHCSNQVGQDAAKCLAELFVAAYCHGPPHADSFAPDYDPVSDLESHLRGEPGNCVTRTALIAAALLANGIPARQVQYITPKTGHTAVEVWDADRWVYFDPTFGGAFRDGSGLLPAPAALARGQGEFVHASNPASSETFDYVRGKGGRFVTLSPGSTRERGVDTRDGHSDPSRWKWVPGI